MKTKRAKSKRINSSTRHKVERKKREHKRDLRKAAKAMKSAGLGPQRSKRTRETAKLALRVSNSHPDKEEILTRILQAREQQRVLRADKRKKKAAGEDSEEEGDEQPQEVPQAANKKALLFVPNSKSNDFSFQFTKALDEIVYPIALDKEISGEDAAIVEQHGLKAELPSCVYIVTVDSRCAAQSAPWTLIDAIVERAKAYDAAQPAEQPSKKRNRTEEAPAPKAKKAVLILFALAKCDLVSSTAISSQFALLANAVHHRYFEESTDAKKSSKGQVSNLTLPGGIEFGFVPVSNQFERCQKQLLKALRRFHAAHAVRDTSAAPTHNMNDKVCAFIIGLPNTGRRTLARSLLATGTDSGVAVVPLRAAQVQLIKAKDDAALVNVRFALPNSKTVTLVLFPEDARYRKESSRDIVAGDVLFQPYKVVEHLEDPEMIATAIAQQIVDPVAIAQAFCQVRFTTGDNEEAIKSIWSFLKGIGHTVRREGGFHVSPLFVSTAGTAGQIAATNLTASTNFTSGQQSNKLTLLDSTYSNARPSKLVRLSNVTIKGKGKHQNVKRIDGGNALKIGARTFVREVCQGKNIPWAIMRAHDEVLSPQRVAEVSRVFNAIYTSTASITQEATQRSNAAEFLQLHMDQLTNLLKDVLVLLPNGVVEFSPNAIVPVLHNLDVEEESESESDEESDVEEDDEEQEGDEEEGDEEDDEEDDDDEELEEGEFSDDE
ncbi:Hypothetical protein, putative [Bodo saltans]|uniref:Uncharacterized protein n=1 Tax=Bodo saltans TaxID=75058 RepID=A0A0S4KI95_BODSA|nr:Hypothetical protein, putative [Bodo saltans]|eukprot:CUI14119.1 Hypothetical protein, putative [Bodo saltans]